jgi:hypothetical protein
MSSVVVYRETLYWRMIFALIGVVDIPLFLALLYEMSLPPAPDPSEIAVLLVVLVIMAALLLTFGRLTITMTASGITIGFGLSKQRFGWGEVEECYLDDTSAWKYGGYGIKAGVHNGRKRLVYNISGAKAVVLKVKGKKYDEFVFSTKNPDQCLRLIRMQTGKPAT